MRRFLAIVTVAVAGLVIASTAAVDAATLFDAGWWDRDSDSLLPKLDPPPDDSLRIANDPAGASAIAAVRYELDEGETDPVLVLRVLGDPAPATASLVACPSVGGWTGADGGSFDDRPESDCVTGAAAGRVADDGTTVAFDLAPLVRDTVLDVVISPAPVGNNPVDNTYAIDFARPGDVDLTTRAAASSPAPPVAPTADAAPGDSGGSTAAGPSFTPSPSPVGGGFDAPTGSTDFTVDTPADPGAPVPDGGATTDSGAVAPPLATGDEVASANPAADTATGGRRFIGLAVAAAILALGAYLWRADRERATAAAGPMVGGLGPFVRERTAPAPDVA